MSRAREDELDPIFKALSDPTRRRILDLLNTRARTTGELASEFDLSRFAVMKHLGVLESAGLIGVRRQGRERWNHLQQAPIQRVYARWISRHTAWAATPEGQLAVRAPDADPDAEILKELYIIIRPEERYPVERAIQSVVPPVYSTLNAVGRGAYWEPAPDTRRMRWAFNRKKQLSEFLPKVILMMVVPEPYVEPLLTAVSAALRLQGGPEECGTGFAAVLGVESELVVGTLEDDGPQDRARTEGWGERPSEEAS